MFHLLAFESDREIVRCDEDQHHSSDPMPAVGGELKSHFRLETVGGFHKSKVSHGDQLVFGNSIVGIASSVFHYQRLEGFYQFFPDGIITGGDPGLN